MKTFEELKNFIVVNKVEVDDLNNPLYADSLSFRFGGNLWEYKEIIIFIINNNLVNLYELSEDINIKLEYLENYKNKVNTIIAIGKLIDNKETLALLFKSLIDNISIEDIISVPPTPFGECNFAGSCDVKIITEKEKLSNFIAEQTII